MNEPLDPYYIWLGIPPAEQPPHLYRLLGIRPFEDNQDVIAHAVDRLMMHVRSFHLGPHSQLSQRILNEIADARICLLDPDKKAGYDRQLRGTFAQQAATSVPDDPTWGAPSRADQAVPMGALAVPPTGAATAGQRTTRSTLRRRSNQPLVMFAFIAGGAIMGLLLGWWIISSLQLGPREETVVVPSQQKDTPVPGGGQKPSRQRPVPQKQSPEPRQPTQEEPPAKADITPAPRQEVLEIPSWWDDQIRAQADYASAHNPAFATVQAGLSSDSPAARREVFDQLVEQQKEAWSATPHQRSELISALLALDPDDENADALIRSLVGVIAVCTHSLPDDVAAYDDAVWAVRTWIHAIFNPTITPARKSHLAGAFSRLVDVPIAWEASQSELTEQCERASAALLYAGLATHGATDPGKAALLRSRLYSLCRTRLNVRDAARLDAQFLAALLPHLGDKWRTYMSLINMSFRSREPSILMPVLEAYARTDNPELEEFITQRLQRHIRGPARFDADKETIVNTLRQQFTGRGRPRNAPF